MKKNIASQSIGAQMVAAADGTAFTSAVTVYVTGDSGTQAIGSVGSGVCTHEGNGYHSYAPTQAETNYDHIAFTFIGTAAVPQTVQLYTEFPQTGDAFDRIGALGAGLTSLAPSATALSTAVWTAPPPSASTISTQVNSDLTTAHGSGSYIAATGFATSEQAVKLLAAVYDTATVSGSTLTLSNAATQVVTAGGRVTTG